jgi:hypothetical protein
MSDIVERLRRVGQRVPVPCPDKLEGCLVFHSKIETDPACLDAINEIERMRAALEKIAAMDEVSVTDFDGVNGKTHQCVARAALAKHKAPA